MNQSTRKNIHAFSALTKQKALWHEPSLRKNAILPAPIANEYRTLYELTEQGEVYQAVVKLKDFAEVCYRAVVLTAIAALSRQAAAKGQSAGSAYMLLSDFLTRPPSIGNWEEKLAHIKQEYSHLLPPALSDVVAKVNEMKNKLPMSAYRNEYIGHGAYMAAASEKLAEETEHMLTVLVKSLSELYPLWASFTLELQEKPQQGWQAVRRPAFHTEKPVVRCGDTSVPVSQFILFEDKRYYFFDKYNRTTGATEYLCFSDGRRLSRQVPLFSDLCRTYDSTGKGFIDGELDSRVIPYGLSVTLDEISHLALDFVEDTSVTQWLQQCLERHDKGIFVLQGPKGSGKSAYCAALDPLVSPYDHISLENTEVRCYYGSRSALYPHLDFANFTENVFNLKNQAGLRKQIFSVSGNMTHAKENTGAADIAAMLREWRSIHDRNGETHCEKLLYVIDGVDQMCCANAGLEKMIPTVGMLSDGVYMLLTTRGTIPAHLTATEARDITSSDIQNISRKMIDKVYQKTLGFGAGKLPAFIRDDLAATQMAVSVMKRDGNRTIRYNVETLVKRYLEILFAMYGTQLSGRSLCLINAMLDADRPLGLRELCDAVGDYQISLSTIGILRDLGCLLDIDYSGNEVRYQISLPVSLRLWNGVKLIEWRHSEIAHSAWNHKPNEIDLCNVRK